MKPHELRVILEKQELDEKLEKLRAFCFIPNSIFNSLDAVDKKLLETQWYHMHAYSDILARRIARFGEAA